MTRVGIRVIGPIVAAVLATALLVACGGSDSSTSNTASSAETTDAGSQSSNSNGKPTDTASKEGGNEGTRSGQSSGGSGSVDAAPLRVSGGGSEQFRGKGGDNSIQNFGEEGEESELEEAAEALHSFYVARAEEDWSAACAYVAKSVTQQLQQLGSQSPELKGKGCAATLHALTRPLPASVRRESTVVDAGSLRTEDDQSFIIYYGEGHAAYAMPMIQEDGGWKVGLLSATPLE